MKTQLLFQWNINTILVFCNILSFFPQLNLPSLRLLFPHLKPLLPPPLLPQLSPRPPWVRPIQLSPTMELLLLSNHSQLSHLHLLPHSSLLHPWLLSRLSVRPLLLYSLSFLQLHLLAILHRMEANLHQYRPVTLDHPFPLPSLQLSLECLLPVLPHFNIQQCHLCHSPPHSTQFLLHQALWLGFHPKHLHLPGPHTQACRVLL